MVTNQPGSAQHVFGWKKKTAGISSVCVFGNQSEDGDDDLDAIISNATAASSKKATSREKQSAEDRALMADKLLDEACDFASNGRLASALNKLNQAILASPRNEKLYEMKGQVHLELNEDYPAVKACRKAVSIAPHWPIAHQTLGRAYLNMGEVKKAKISLSKAVVIDPSEKSVWADIEWCRSILKKRKIFLVKEAAAELSASTKSGPSNSSNTGGVTITEQTDETFDNDTLSSAEKKDICGSTDVLSKVIVSTYEAATSLSDEDEQDEDEDQEADDIDDKDSDVESEPGAAKSGRTIRSIPQSYVCMRDLL